jgi:hypothetical protein
MGKAIYGRVVAGCCALLTLQAQTTVLYETKFERAEGYDPNLDLAGQRGWRIDGTGGNGLLEEFFPGLGQQAYIGFQPPQEGEYTVVWRPIDFSPPPTNTIVKFSVKMGIMQSTAGGDDEFRWAIYNRSGGRLFGLNFETASGDVSYQNEDLIYRSSGWKFPFGGAEDLEIWMDFTRNSWTARFNDIVLANAQPISVTNATEMSIGDVDAVWFINNLAGVGNNYMVFDDYRVVSERLKAIPAFLEPLRRTSEGFFQFVVYGQPEVPYAVEYSTDFQSWNLHGEYQDDEGTFVFEDHLTGTDRYRFYRVRELL